MNVYLYFASSQKNDESCYFKSALNSLHVLSLTRFIGIKLAIGRK